MYYTHLLQLGMQSNYMVCIEHHPQQQVLVHLKILVSHEELLLCIILYTIACYGYISCILLLTYICTLLLSIHILVLLGFGVITSDSVEDAFRGVDRKFFVPRVRETAYMFPK